MKGIILAGGTGTRLHPATLAVNKQLLPIYDKPMIYYPLSTLMLGGIREIQIISSPDYINNYRNLFGNGDQYGITIEYAIQHEPKGLAQALIIGDEFIKGSPATLILGDNLFYGAGLPEMIVESQNRAINGVATVFGYRVDQPSQYGVIELDDAGRALNIEEKPKNPKSNWALTGLYVYDGRASELARKVKPSKRGELEITELNCMYMEEGNLQVERMGRGYAWLDTGTHDTLLEASEFVRAIQKRQGIQLACIEEIAYNNGWIDKKQVADRANKFRKTEYGRYLLKNIVNNDTIDSR